MTLTTNAVRVVAGGSNVASVSFYRDSNGNGTLTVKEAAEMLGVSPRTADNLWAYARAWLLNEIEAGPR